MYVADLHPVLGCIETVERLAEDEMAREVEDDKLELADDVDIFVISTELAELLHQSRDMVAISSARAASAFSVNAGAKVRLKRACSALGLVMMLQAQLGR